jgi:hypothetical protein
VTQSRSELIDIVGRILASGDWDNHDIDNCDIGPKSEVRGYAEEIVTALLPEANDEPRPAVKLNDWHPDCGGGWVLSGPGYFANYWPDNTVIVDILDTDGNVTECSNMYHGDSKAECQAFAENWLRERL